MGYSVVNVKEIEPAGSGGAGRCASSVAGPHGLTMIAVGARRGSYEPRGPY
jgi:hypothetical protein